MNEADKKANDEFRDNVMKGLELSYQRLIEKKRRNDQEIVIMKDGKIVKIKP